MLIALMNICKLQTCLWFCLVVVVEEEQHSQDFLQNLEGVKLNWAKWSRPNILSHYVIIPHTHLFHRTELLPFDQKLCTWTRSSWTKSLINVEGLADANSELVEPLCSNVHKSSPAMTNLLPARSAFYFQFLQTRCHSSACISFILGSCPRKIFNCTRIKSKNMSRANLSVGYYYVLVRAYQQHGVRSAYWVVVRWEGGYPHHSTKQ